MSSYLGRWFSSGSSIGSKLFPLMDRVLVKKLVAELKTEGGILLPDNAAKGISEGKVVAVGPGRTTAKGTVVPVSLKVGDRVLLPEYGAMKFSFEGEELLLYREDDILCRRV